MECLPGARHHCKCFTYLGGGGVERVGRIITCRGEAEA